MIIMEDVDHKICKYRLAEERDYYFLRMYSPELFNYIPNFLEGIQTGNPIIVVADRDGFIEGVMAATVFDYSFEMKKKSAEMLIFGVSPIFRRIGIADDLFFELMSQLHHRKVLYIYQILHRDYHNAIKFLFHHEFHEVYLDDNYMLIWRYTWGNELSEPPRRFQFNQNS